jgi:5-methylcytosine-specific restriction protein A
MPAKPLHPCAHPGCPALTHERYCPAHKLAASRSYNRNQRNPTSNADYGRRWRTIRNLYIAAHPLCEDCLAAGRLVPADEVHHIVPLDRGGDNADSNLRSLCQSCHTKPRSP